MTFNEIFPLSTFFFSAYFRIPSGGVKSVFVYQNDSSETEDAYAFIFPSEGVGAKNWNVIHKQLLPSDSLAVNTREISILLGEHVKEGTIFLCVRGSNFEKTMTAKDFASNWVSAAGGSLFAVGPFRELNVPQTKAKKSFFMFCPVVARKGEINTFNVLINHSSDPEYADTVELIPELANLSGEKIVGQPVFVPPFGCITLDIESYFGDAGMELLAKTNGYGRVTIQHVGHVLASYFGQSDQSGEIICGNHTQPPFGATGGLSSVAMLKEHIKRIFPWIVYLRNRERINE